MSDQSKPTSGEWTAERVQGFVRQSEDWTQTLANAINAALTAHVESAVAVLKGQYRKQLAAEREKLCPNCGRPLKECHGNCIFNLNDKPTEDQSLSYTPFGLVQYPDGSKAVMTYNEAEAKRLVEWHNAALAAERERREALTSIYDETALQLTEAREQLAAEVEKVNKLQGWCEQLQPHYDAVADLQKQLAAERKKVKELEERLRKYAA